MHEQHATSCLRAKEVHLTNHKDKQLSGLTVNQPSWRTQKISGFSKLHTFYHFIIKSSVTYPLFVSFHFACPGMLIPPFTPCWKFSIIPVTQPSRRLSIHLFITFYHLHRVLEPIPIHMGQRQASPDSLPDLTQGWHQFQYVFKYSVSQSMSHKSS